MAAVATDFKVRPYFGDFNAVFALRERYRKNTYTRISDVDVIAIIGGFVIYAVFVAINKGHRGCVGWL